MRTFTVSLGLVALVAAAPMVRAQDQDENTAEFRQAREQVVAGHTRQAANTLLISSVYLRQQLGRSKDEVTWTKLLDAERQVEKMALGMRGGTVPTLKTLDRTLMAVDRLLAVHHVQVAQLGIARPRATELPDVARDIDRAAFHFERSFTLDGSVVPAEPAAAIGDARAVAKEIVETKVLPARTGQVVAMLERLVTGTGTVIAAAP